MSHNEETHTSGTMTVTIDARALDGTRMGTQVHVLELVRALANTERLHLRVLVRGEEIDRETLALLRKLPNTEILDARALVPDTPKSAVFHRPVQTFSHEDVALACDLGERIVLSQLDLIAYSNPGYFPDASAFEDYRRASRHGMSAAERVVVFSEHTRAEMLAEDLVEDERIRVVPPGLDHDSTAEPRRPAGLQQSVESGFLLCLGADYTHKNRVFALRLLAELQARHGWRGELVFAGAHVAHGSSQESERELLDAHPELRVSVSDLGPVDEAEKAWLTAQTAAIVYPSLHEGFGLVPFESGPLGRALPVRGPIFARRGSDRQGRDDRPGGPCAQRRGGIPAARRSRRPRGARARTRRGGSRAHLGARGHGDDRDLPRGGARTRTRRGDAESRRGGARTRAERDPPRGRTDADRRT